MRFAFAIGAALALGSIATAQQSCPNGQCPTARYVYPQQQQSPQFGVAVPAAGRVEVRNVTGLGPTRVLLGENGKPDVFLGPAGAPAPAACPGGVCPVPAAPRSPFQISADVPALGGATEALDEVNAARARHGLPPFARDENLTRGAMGCAQARAARLQADHTPNDFAFAPPGTACSATGCAAWPPSLGWGACCSYDGYRTAGAAYAIGADGKRYMSLFVR